MIERLLSIPSWLWALAVAALLLFFVGVHERNLGDAAGAARIQKQWDAERAANAEAEKKAILQRTEDNTELQRMQNQQLAANERAHQDEIDNVKRTAAVLAAQRLRVPTTTCAGLAGPTQAGSAGSGDAAATGTVPLPEPIDTNLRALMVEADTIVANCRAAQQFIKDNGFDKE